MSTRRSPDQICAAFADTPEKITVRHLESDFVLAEGSAEALGFWGTSSLRRRTLPKTAAFTSLQLGRAARCSRQKQQSVCISIDCLALIIRPGSKHVPPNPSFERTCAKSRAVRSIRTLGGDMGVLADFYLSTDDAASAYDHGSFEPEEDRAQFKGITTLELTTLWAFLDDTEWNVDMLDHFHCLLERDGGEVLVHRIPTPLVKRLKDLDERKVRDLASRWAATEELACAPEDVLPVLAELVRLSASAEKRSKGLYLWNCV